MMNHFEIGRSLALLMNCLTDSRSEMGRGMNHPCESE